MARDLRWFVLPIRVNWSSSAMRDYRDERAARDLEVKIFPPGQVGRHQTERVDPPAGEMEFQQRHLDAGRDGFDRDLERDSGKIPVARLAADVLLVVAEDVLAPFQRHLLRGGAEPLEGDDFGQRRAPGFVAAGAIGHVDDAGVTVAGGDAGEMLAAP